MPKLSTKTVHARLDQESSKLLTELCGVYSENASEVIRKGIRMLASASPTKPKRKFFKAGQFDSGMTDLGSNKKHLKGFGE
jgi:hypothetical protein